MTTTVFSTNPNIIDCILDRNRIDAWWKITKTRSIDRFTLNRRIYKKKEITNEIITIKPLFKQYDLLDVLPVVQEQLDKLYYIDYVNQFKNKKIGDYLFDILAFHTRFNTFYLEKLGMHLLSSSGGSFLILEDDISLDISKESDRAKMKKIRFNELDPNYLVFLYEYYYNPSNWKYQGSVVYAKELSLSFWYDKFECPGIDM